MIQTITFEPVRGGLCGPHLAVRADQRWVGHFYPDAERDGDQEEFMALAQAAPELLRALQDIARRAEEARQCRAWSTQRLAADVEDIARAAISQVEGRT